MAGAFRHRTALSCTDSEHHRPVRVAAKGPAADGAGRDAIQAAVDVLASGHGPGDQGGQAVKPAPGGDPDNGEIEGERKIKIIKNKLGETNRKDWKFYVDGLNSEECACGRAKKPGYSFCLWCYRRLPRDMQRDLYEPLGQGYERAYEAAVKWLEL